MKASQRLLVMIAGLLVLASGTLAWLGGALPANTIFGTMVSTALSSAFGNAIIINIPGLSQVSTMLATFTVGIVVMVAAALGSKGISLIGAGLTTLLIAAWFAVYGMSIGDIFGSFAALGLGTQLAMLSVILIIVALVLPKLRRRSSIV